MARVLGPKGLDGMLRLELLTDWPERLEPGAALFIEDEEAPRRVVTVERGGRVPAIRLEGIATRDEAEAFVGRYLEAEKRPLPPDTYYWHELEGLDVYDESGTRLGTLTEVFRAGGGEVYRVDTDHGERLVPALREVVLEIDLTGGRMVVRDDEAEEVR